MAEKRLLTLEEFMDEFCMKRSSALTAIKKGKLKTKRMSEGGKKIFITREDAEAWLDSLVDAK
jgi:hypothetical protein